MRLSFLRRPTFWYAIPLAFIVAAILFPIYVEYGTNSPFAVRRLPQRIKILTPGMTRDQVWQTLGVRPVRGGAGGGGRNHYEGYGMGWYGYSVYLVMDVTQQPNRLVRARLYVHGK